MVERAIRIREALGSIPEYSIIFFNNSIINKKNIKYVLNIIEKIHFKFFNIFFFIINYFNLYTIKYF